MKRPWLVRTHYRMRSASFAALFVATALHLMDRASGPLLWSLLALILLVYPHVQYWRACRAADPVRTEMDNLLADSVLLGVYAAAVGFAAWLAFSAALGTLVNNAGNKGWRGVGQTLAALPAGALAWIALAGLDFAPATGWLTTTFCMAGLAAYVTAIGHLGYARNRQLRAVREDLRKRESELLGANTTLLRQLNEIDGLQLQLREQATRDSLTGLYNRRYLDGTLERELARCQRDDQPLALMMIDIDHFKRINDTYGHPAGDEVLRRVGALLASAARAGDVACRYGGEEFVLLLPTMTTTIARERAEALRTAFAAITVEFGDARVQATLSIGIAVFPGHGSAAADLLRRADEALYRAKECGRNRVEVAPGATDSGQGGQSFIKLVWHSAYESGHPVIDEEHRALFGQANHLLAALFTGRPAAEMAILVDALVQDVAAHFRSEETIVAASGFPEAAAHAAIHSELIERARALSERFRAGDADLGELFRFVAEDMIARHFLGADREFFAHLGCAARRSGTAAP